MQFSRTELLYGTEGMSKLKNASVIVFGIGGVGGYVCEALARSGISRFTLVDNDVISLSNINRQIIALHSTVGQYKTEAMKERMLDINPNGEITVKNTFFLPENAHEFDFSTFDYVVDAVDTVSAKIAIIQKAKAQNVPVISCMGAGNKIHPELFEIANLSQTSVCPLARVMRKELKERGITDVKVVYSKEEPIKITTPRNEHGKQTPGSVSFAPSVAGLLLASQIINDLVK